MVKKIQKKMRHFVMPKDDTSDLLIFLLDKAEIKHDVEYFTQHVRADRQTGMAQQWIDITIY